MNIGTRHTTTITAGAVIAAALLGGCRGERSNEPPRQFLPDMDDSPKWKAQSQSKFFTDERTMRPEVGGAVAWGRFATLPEDVGRAELASMLTDDRVALLGEDREINTGVTPDGAWATRIPNAVNVDRDVLDLGQEKFNIYCAVCHGMLGDGEGMVGQRWSTILPDFHDAKYKNAMEYTGADGYIFDVARNGVWDTAEITADGVEHSGNQRMPGYAHALTERETWAVVAYIRALQASRTTDLDALPQAERDRLVGSKPAASEPEAPADDSADDANNNEEAGG